jgi:hypothetical protein
MARRYNTIWKQDNPLNKPQTKPDTSRFLGNAWDFGRKETFTGLAKSAGSNFGLWGNQEKITETDWNETHPLYRPGIEWDHNMDVSKAYEMARNYDIERGYEEMYARASGGQQILGTTVKWGTMLLADETNLIPFVGGVAKGANLASKLWKGFKYGAVTGGAFGAAEVGLSVPAYDERGQEQLSFTEGVATIALATLLGGGIGMVGEGFGHWVAKRKHQNKVHQALDNDPNPNIKNSDEADLNPSSKRMRENEKRTSVYPAREPIAGVDIQPTTTKGKRLTIDLEQYNNQKLVENPPMPLTKQELYQRSKKQIVFDRFGKRLPSKYQNGRIVAKLTPDGEIVFEIKKLTVFDLKVLRELLPTGETFTIKNLDAKKSLRLKDADPVEVIEDGRTVSKVPKRSKAQETAIRNEANLEQEIVLRKDKSGVRQFEVYEITTNVAGTRKRLRLINTDEIVSANDLFLKKTDGTYDYTKAGFIQELNPATGKYEPLAVPDNLEGARAEQWLSTTYFNTLMQTPHWDVNSDMRAIQELIMKNKLNGLEQGVPLDELAIQLKKTPEIPLKSIEILNDPKFKTTDEMKEAIEMNNANTVDVAIKTNLDKRIEATQELIDENQKIINNNTDASDPKVVTAVEQNNILTKQIAQLQKATNTNLERARKKLLKGEISVSEFQRIEQESVAAPNSRVEAVVKRRIRDNEKRSEQTKLQLNDDTIATYRDEVKLNLSKRMRNNDVDAIFNYIDNREMIDAFPDTKWEYVPKRKADRKTAKYILEGGRVYKLTKQQKGKFVDAGRIDMTPVIKMIDMSYGRAIKGEVFKDMVDDVKGKQYLACHINELLKGLA